MRAACLAAAAAILAFGTAAAETYRPPRTALGHPDLEGVWSNASLTRLERPAEFATTVIPEARAREIERAHTGEVTIADDPVGQAATEWWETGGTFARIGGEARTAWIVDPPDGRIPYAEAGRRRFEAGLAPVGSDGPEARTTSDRCLAGVGTPATPPMLNANYNANYQIVQTRDDIAIVSEMVHDVRLIRLDGSRRLAAPGRPWMGDSVGRWEGDVLVVETRNLNPQEAMRGSATTGRSFISPDSRIVERFRRLSRDELLYEFTVKDPVAYTRPWRAQMVFRRATGPMFEFACHEGNYSMAGILAGARAAEAAARPGPPQTAR